MLYLLFVVRLERYRIYLKYIVRYSFLQLSQLIEQLRISKQSKYNIC